MIYNKKGQSALEFLTTYGWAFLVILVMAAALMYFGVFNTANILPDKCLFKAPFHCGEKVANTTGIFFSLTNGAGKAITLKSATFTQTGATCTNPTVAYCPNGGTTVGCVAIADNNVPADSKAYLVLHCDANPGVDNDADDFTLGDRPKASVVIQYTESGSTFTQKATGDISLSIT